MIAVHIFVSVLIFMYTWTHTEFENVCKIFVLTCTAVVFGITSFTFLIFGHVCKNFVKRLLASSCLPVRLSVRMEKLDTHWIDFMKFDM
jgi:hypothetical protein